MRYGLQLVSEWDPAKAPKNGVVEVKEDGIAVIADGPGGVLHTREGRTVTHRFPDVTPHLPRNAVLVAELCVFDWGPPRVSRFEGGIQKRVGLENRAEIRLRTRTHPVTAYAYDVLELDGANLMSRPLRERRRALEALLPRPVRDETGATRVLVAEQYPLGDLERLQRVVREAGMEGLVVKDQDAPYVATPEKGKRATSWSKIKMWHEDVRDIRRWETTEKDGFVLYVPVPTPEGEQRVAVNDPLLQARVRAGARLARVCWLNHTRDGSLRQAWVKGLE